MTQAHRLLRDGLAFPEGPCFLPSGALALTEIHGGGLVLLDRAGQHRRVATGGRPNGLAADKAGGVFICDGGSGEVRHLADVEGRADAIRAIASERDAPNDLAFDIAGNLVFTCPGDSRTVSTGSVWCVRADGSLVSVASELRFPNGLAFTLDGSELIVAETYLGRLMRGKWDAARCCWSEVAVFAETTPSPNGPDGMAVAADGRVFVAVYGAGCVDVFTSEGTRAGRIEIAGRNPTNCAFDPSGELGLVVTEAERGELWSVEGLGAGASLFTSATEAGPC